jgi:RNA polymerase sigma-70 factor, ECF subfamily
VSPQPLIVTDLSLVARVRRGDGMARMELQRRHAESLYALAYAVLGDPEASDGVVTETFDRVARRASEYNPAFGSVFSWLKAMARVRATSIASHRHRSFPSPRAQALSTAAV